MNPELTAQIIKKLAKIIELGQTLSEFESIEAMGPVTIQMFGARIRDEANSIGLKLDQIIEES